MYAQGQKIGKPNKLKIIGRKKTKGTIRDICKSSKVT